MGHQGRAIGIDLGTTYSCVAIWQNGKAEVIANDQGNRTTPSMVAFTAQERLIGEGAKHQIALNPKNTVFDVKRLIGRRFCEASVQRDIELWPFQVVPDDVGNPLIEVQYKGEKIRFPPQQISAMVLEKMKTTAEEYLNTSVRNAVITVPAYFNDAQRKATRDAGTVAGLNVTRIINEPSAAAIAYGFRPDCYAGTDPKTILVFDLGGGTFDVSIVSLCMGRLQVKGVGGDMHLGGEDFDNNLLDFCVAQFQRRNENAASSSDITANARALRRLRSECERAKRTLSAAVETVIDIDALHDGCDFRLRITRSKFEELNEKLFLQCINIVEGCLRDASMKTEDVDEVVLVGGSARIPRIQQLLEEFLPGIPLSRTLNFDEAVAMGAAIQAASLANEGVQVELSDVVRLSLGVSINGGEMNFVVPRNTPLPTVKEKRYTTRFDGQSEVCFPLYEGERPLVADNNLLAEFKLTGIPPKPAGVPDIKVTFSVDEDATVTVSAKDEICGMAKQMVISHDCGRLSAAEIERMIADAEHFRREDEEARRRLVARNSLDALIHNLRRRLLASAAQGHMTARDAERMQALLGSSEDWLDDHENASAEQLQELLRSVRSACRPLLQIPPERLITFP